MCTCDICNRSYKFEKILDSIPEESDRIFLSELYNDLIHAEFELECINYKKDKKE